MFYGYNPINYLADFFGLSYLIHNNLDYTVNLTWWYMSICVVYYILFPLLNRVFLKLPETLLAVSFCFAFISFSYAQLNIWLFPFVLGMYVAKTNLFERISNALSYFFNRLLLSCIFVVICAYARRCFVHNSVLLDGFFGLSIILFTYQNISRIPFINKALEELGKYSGMIFMFHTFIFSYYFKEFIYGFKYSILIYIIFVAICCIVARLLKYLEYIIRYDKLINKMLVVKNEKN